MNEARHAILVAQWCTNFYKWINFFPVLQTLPVSFIMTNINVIVIVMRGLRIEMNGSNVTTVHFRVSQDVTGGFSLTSSLQAHTFRIS